MDLVEIVKKHDLKGLKENLKFSNINECDENKNTLLHLAIFNNDSGIVNYLILNSIDIDRMNEDGNTPLHFSILYNRLGIFKHLIKLKVNINIVNNNLESPLMLAMRLGRELMVKILLEAKANKEFKNKLGEGIEFYALYLKGELSLSFLNKINPLSITNIFGDTLLHRAAYLDNIDAMRCLVKFHLLVNKQNKAGETPLFLAGRRGLYDSINILLHNHALFDIENTYDELLSDIVTFKIKDYIDVKKNDLNYLDYLKNYPLHVAVIKNDLYMVKSLNTIIRKNKRDVYGYTPLEYAEFYGFENIINELNHY